jgi:hypothetical protein
MDDLEMLSRMRADVPEADPLALRRARRQLLARAVGPRLTVARSRSRRLVLRTAVAAGLAAVLAGGIVAADSLTSNGRPVTGASAEAANLLNLAAAHTRPDPAIRPGQYRYVVTHAWYGTSFAESGRDISYLTEQKYEIWIPATETQTWYWRYTRPMDARFFSAADERYVRQQHPDWLVPHVELYTGTAGTILEDRSPAAGGKVGDQQQGTPAPGWGTPTSQWLATLPREPGALLDRIHRDTAGAGPDRDTEAFVTIGDVLRTGLVPADLRAALYRVAARIPGVRLIDSAANLDGQRGVAVGRDNPWGARDEIIFDTVGGQFIGERGISTDARVSGAPVGTVVESTAVTVRVVDRPGFH